MPRRPRRVLRLFVLLGLLACLSLGSIGCTKPKTRLDLEVFRAPSMKNLTVRRIALYPFSSALGSVGASTGVQGGEIRRLGDAASAQLHGSGEMPEVFHNFFVGALMDRNITVVERQRVLELIQEQQLANRNFLDLSDREKALRVGRLLDCDLMLYGEALADETSFFFELNGLGTLFLLLPIPIYFPGIFTVLPEQTDLAIAKNEGTLDLANPTYHSIWARNFQGMSLRALDVSTGEIAWIAVVMRYDHQKLGADGTRGAAEINSLTGLRQLSHDLVLNLLGAGGAR